MSFSRKVFAALALFWAASVPALSAQGAVVAPDCRTPASEAGRYATVNGLRMYYEVHGPAAGTPVVLIHGALSNIENSFGKLLPTLSCARRVIAIEYQAHGHTADIARTLTTAQIADDVSELLRQLNVPQADVIGYSMGGLSALQFAVRHPAQLRRLVLISAGFGQGAWTPELKQFMGSIDPNNAPWAEFWKAEYQRLNPRPELWPAPLVRVKESFLRSGDLTAEQVAAVTQPTLVIVGDRDVVPLDHILTLYRTLPHGQLAVLPNTDHYPGVPDHGALIAQLVAPFFD